MALRNSQVGKRVLAAVLIGFAPVVMSAASAEDSDRGRLADGRAFRKDTEGNEIVDYIAELELNNDALQRQVHGLEYEVEQRQKKLDALEHRSSSSGTTNSKLLERDVVSRRDSADSSQGDCSVEQCKAYVGREISAGSAVQDARIDELELLTRSKDEQLVRLRSEANDAKVRIASLERAIDIARAGGSSDVKADVNKAAALQKRVIELEDQLVVSEKKFEDLNAAFSARTDEVSPIKVALRESQDEKESLKTKIAELEDKISKSSKDRDEAIKLALRESEEKLSATDSELKLVKAKLAMVSESASEATASYTRARLGDDSGVVGTLSTGGTQEARADSMSQVRKNAIDALRGRLNLRLSGVRQLISKRDSLYSQYRKQSRPVSVSIKEPLSSRGLGVREITGRLRAVTSVIELSQLARDTAEVEAKIREDIALLERLGRR